MPPSNGEAVAAALLALSTLKTGPVAGVPGPFHPLTVPRKFQGENHTQCTPLPYRFVVFTFCIFFEELHVLKNGALPPNLRPESLLSFLNPDQPGSLNALPVFGALFF